MDEIVHVDQAEKGGIWNLLPHRVISHRSNNRSIGCLADTDSHKLQIDSIQ